METNLRNAFLLLSPLPQEGEGGVRGKYSQKLKAESVRYARFQLSTVVHTPTEPSLGFARDKLPVRGGGIYVIYPHKTEENQN